MKSGSSTLAPVAISGYTQTPDQNGIGIKPFSHREMICDINQTVDWTLRSYDINPGLDDLFPWLSGVATHFERYCLLALEIEYKPRCPTIAGGGISIAIDYDTADAPPPDAKRMESYAGCVSDSIWAKTRMKASSTILRERQRQHLFVRAGRQDADQRLSDLGRLYIATSGANPDNDGMHAGRLFVNYTVQFFTPQLEDLTENLSASGRKTLVESGSDKVPISSTRGAVNLVQDVMDQIKDVQDKGKTIEQAFGAVQNLAGILNVSPTTKMPITLKKALKLSPTASMDHNCLVFEHEWTGRLYFKMNCYTYCSTMLSGGSFSWTPITASDWQSNPYLANLSGLRTGRYWSKNQSSETNTEIPYQWTMWVPTSYNTVTINKLDWVDSFPYSQDCSISLYVIGPNGRDSPMVGRYKTFSANQSGHCCCDTVLCCDITAQAGGCLDLVWLTGNLTWNDYSSIPQVGVQEQYISWSSVTASGCPMVMDALPAMTKGIGDNPGDIVTSIPLIQETLRGSTDLIRKEFGRSPFKER